MTERLREVRNNVRLGPAERQRGGGGMTSPPEKLVEVLETLPVDTRREILVWLLGQNRPMVGAPWTITPEPRLRAMLGMLGGALPAGEESQLVTIRLPADRHAELRTWCTENSFTMASVVRGLVERFLEDQHRKE